MLAWVCVCLGVSLSSVWGLSGWVWGWQGSLYVECQLWGYSCASNSSLALRVEASKLGPSHLSAPSLS